LAGRVEACGIAHACPQLMVGGITQVQRRSRCERHTWPAPLSVPSQCRQLRVGNLSIGLQASACWRGIAGGCRSSARPWLPQRARKLVRSGAGPRCRSFSGSRRSSSIGRIGDADIRDGAWCAGRVEAVAENLHRWPPLMVAAHQVQAVEYRCRPSTCPAPAVRSTVVSVSLQRRIVDRMQAVPACWRRIGLVDVEGLARRWGFPQCRNWSGSGRPPG